MSSPQLPPSRSVPRRLRLKARLSAIMSKLKEKFGKLKQKIGEQVDDLQGDLSRLKVAAAYTYNPNHRHDEDHERESDRIRQEILDSHRYQSFAPQRESNNVKWYIDGMDYFWALSEILEQATSTIWICDWWLSPELYLRRPPSQYEAYRLDRILKRKAEQGVRVFVQIYKEVNTTMTLNSKYTKHALEELHENISVIRHPDHSGGEIVMYWSHHEKIVIVDTAVACIGGLDLCYGRWDTHSAPLADVHADNMTSTVFPGQDYNNSRVADFENVQAWTGNEQARTELGRMPWHDVHTMLTGPAVMDIAQFFVERWNFVRDLKYKHNDRFPLLDWPHDDPLNDQMLRHPHTARFRQGLRFNQERVHLDTRPTGDMHVQVCRSVGDWSCGWLTEHSIQDAYIQLIREANHFIYIENQFFVSIPGEARGPKVNNQICAALAQRVISAAQSGEKFKVMVMIPEVPCFPGDLKASQGTLAIIDTQYRSLCRGKESLYGLIEAAGFNPMDYVTLFNLRQYDRIKFDKDIWKEAEKQSGVLWGEVLAAYARLNIGDEPPSLEERNNRTIRFKAMKYDDVINASAEVKKNEKGQEDITTIDLPPNVRRAEALIKLWESCIPPEYREIASTISRNALQSGRNVSDEPWFGSEAAEKDAFVTEELYIHSKLMIVDDKKVIIGSANINDRSQMGDRDSEIAIVIEDTELIESSMNGQKYMAARFAATFRRQLFKQHLGLVPPQDCPGPVTSAMRPVGSLNEYNFGSQEDRVVEDPLDDEFHHAWNETARINAEVYQELFHCTPAKGVKTWDDYAKWVPAGKKVGHIHNQENLELGYIKQRLSQIRGHVVEMPTDFLENAGLLEISAAVNPVTMPIYL